MSVQFCFNWLLQDTIRYEMVGNERAIEYYYLDPSSGLITVKKLITEGTQNDDTVIVLEFSYFYFVNKVFKLSSMR